MSVRLPWISGGSDLKFLDIENAREAVPSHDYIIQYMHKCEGRRINVANEVHK